MLKKLKVIILHLEEKAALEEEGLLAQFEGRSEAEKMAATIEGVKQEFALIGTKIVGIIKSFSKFVGGIEGAKKILKAIALIYVGIKSSILTANVATALGITLKKKEVSEERKKSAAKVGGVAAAFITNPYYGRYWVSCWSCCNCYINGFNETMV